MSLLPPGRESNDVRFITNTEIWHIRPMYEYLVGVDPETGKVVPQLATSWAVEDGGKAVRFQLRKGVQFHGGHGEFTAKDVVFTRDEMRKDDTTNGLRNFFTSTISDIEIVNDYELIMRMSRVDSTLLLNISEGENGFEIRSKAHFDQIGPPTMESGPLAGTGAYQFKERAQGQYIRFERVPYQHWRVTPEFPELEIRFQRENSTRLAAMLAGETHITVLPEDLMGEAEKKGLKTTSSRVAGLRAFMSIYCCVLNDPKDVSKGWVYPNSPLMDLRVRRALNKAINRDELNKSFFAGKGEVMILPHHHSTRQGWDPSWASRFPEEYGFDPAAARALLAEAGYGPGKPLSTNLFIVPLPSIGAAEDVQEAIAGYWRDVGVRPELLQTDSGEIRAAARERKYSNNIELRGTNNTLFGGMTGYSLTWGARGNYFEDPDLDQGALDAVTTFDEQKQDEGWRRGGESMFVKHSTIPLFWIPAQAVVNPQVVADYVYPGNITGTWTHVTGIKAAK